MRWSASSPSAMARRCVASNAAVSSLQTYNTEHLTTGHVTDTADRWDTTFSAVRDQPGGMGWTGVGATAAAPP